MNFKVSYDLVTVQFVWISFDSDIFDEMFAYVMWKTINFVVKYFNGANDIVTLIFTEGCSVLNSLKSMSCNAIVFWAYYSIDGVKHQDHRAIKSMEKKELLLVNLIDEFFTFCPDKAQCCVIDDWWW